MTAQVRLLVALFGCLALSPLASCDGCSPPAVKPPPAGGACVRTAALDEPRQCVADDDCACGAHCSFGACAFDCRADADCSGGSDACDDFGRCSPKGQRTPALRAVARGTLSNPTSAIHVAAPDTRYFTRVFPRSAVAGALRMQSVGGALLWCPGDETPSGVCDVAQVGPDGVVIGVGLPSVSVAPVDGVQVAPSIEVRDESGKLASIAALTAQGAAPVLLNGDAMSGIYTGTALHGAGGGLLTPIALAGAEAVAANLRGAVSATLSVDDTVTGVLRIDDPTGLVLPIASLVVEIDAGTVHWPALTWLAIEGSNVEVLTAAVDVPMTVPDGAFALDVPLSASGLALPGADAPALGTLKLSFSRIDALPVSFVNPTKTADATAALDAARGLDPLAPGAFYDGLATTFEPSPPVAQLRSGPWNTPPLCTEGVAAASRLAAVAPACDAARSPNELHAPTECPAEVTAFNASGGNDEVRFACAYDLLAPAGTVNATCNPGVFFNWNRCLDDELTPLACSSDANCIHGGACDVTAGVCRFGCVADIDGVSPTGTTRFCASGFCQDGFCTDNTPQQGAEFCASATCGGFQPNELFREDFCAVAQGVTGCQIVDIANPVTVPSSLAALRDPGIFFQNNDPQQQEFMVLAVAETAVRECVVPAYTPEQDCTIAALCTPTPASSTPSTFGPTAEAGNTARRGTGDPLCDDGSLSGAMRGFTTGLDATASVPDLAVCAADLASLPALASSGVLTVGQLTDDTTCFSTARLMAALDTAARGARAGRAPDPAALGIAHRLVQEVAELQALVARDALDQYQQQITFDGNDDPRATLDTLDQSLAAWGFLLDPRVTGLLLSMPGDVLGNPDPRPLLGITADADASEGITQGVGISMVEALSDELAVLDFALQRAWFAGSTSAIADRRARIASALRTGSVVLALSDTLFQRAATAGTVSWEKGYQNARLNYALLVRRILDRAEAIDTGQNPLSIDDIDTPIFFPGDVTGDRNRFLAVSKFLVGTGAGDLQALAPVAVRAAQDALAAARTDWRVDATIVADSARRQDDIIRRYGELITGYCGAPIDDPTFDIGTYNVLDQPLDVETCFVEPACRGRPEDFKETLSAADLGFQICMATRAGLAVGGAAEPGLAATIADLKPAFSKASMGTGVFPLKIVRLEQNVNLRNAVVTVNNGPEVTIPLDGLGQLGTTLSTSLLGAAAATALLATTDDCQASMHATLARRPATSATSCTLADECAVGDKCAAGACVSGAAEDKLDQVSCYYDGAISEQALAVRSAALEVDVARAELDEFIDRYEIARKSCVLLHAGNAAQASELASYNDTINDLELAKTVASSLAHAADAVKDCSDSANSAAGGDPLALEATASFAATACLAAGASAAASIAVDALDNVMDQASRKHDAEVLRIQNNTAEKICYNDASMELVGAKAQTLRIRQAQQAQSAAVINLRGQKSYTAGLWADGNAALEKERRIAEAASLGRFVQSDAAQLYIDRFNYAQRLTYLAVRAVEHELQQPETQARQQVIGAANPDELEQVLTTLATAVNNGTVGGSQPTGLLAVVSLREHILQLSSFSGNPSGEQTLTSEERFRLLLTSPRFAVVDDGGNYLGQQIPFTLAPLGAFGLGNTEGIPIVAQSDCAERLWAVNAAVVGGTDLFDGSSSSFTRLDLLQRNTFASQRCDTNGGADLLEVSTTRPAINLLADVSTTTQQNPSAGAVADFARGLMQPYLNVTRADFERADFSEGSTTQLAGRGLYGDYALFIPAAALSVDGGPGLRLDAVDDILLRFDYVAAAR